MLMKLASMSFETKLGPMIAIANSSSLYFLSFLTTNHLNKRIEHLKQNINADIVEGRTKPIESIQEELDLYFSGNLKKFTTPLTLYGSSFQKNVWEALQAIPFGKTISYASLASSIGNPTACRAVAQANSKNQFAIIIPCHRVINASGKLGGYNGGRTRKEWLLKHEKMQSR